MLLTFVVLLSSFGASTRADRFACSGTKGIVDPAASGSFGALIAVAGVFSAGIAWDASGRAGTASTSAAAGGCAVAAAT